MPRMDRIDVIGIMIAKLFDVGLKPDEEAEGAAPTPESLTADLLEFIEEEPKLGEFIDAVADAIWDKGNDTGRSETLEGGV